MGSIGNCNVRKILGGHFRGNNVKESVGNGREDGDLMLHLAICCGFIMNGWQWWLWMIWWL